MKPKIYHYYYIDENGIDSLFAQLGKPFIDKIINKIQNTTKGSGEVEIGTGPFVKIMGIGEADLKAILSKENISSKEFTEILRIEPKLKILLDSLKTEKELVLLTKDNFNPIALQKGNFVEIEALFKTPKLKEVIGSMTLKREFVTFECRLGKSLIHMGTSLAKYPISLNQLMFAWEEKVELNVFGELTPTKKNEFYLKPFSIRHA